MLDHQEDDDVIDDSPSCRELPSPSRPLSRKILERASSLSCPPIDLGIPDLSSRHEIDEEDDRPSFMDERCTIHRSLAWSEDSMDESDGAEEDVIYSSHNMDYASCFRRYQTILASIYRVETLL